MAPPFSSADPDAARTRLGALGQAPAPERTPTSVLRTAGGVERIGWPGAAPGTPASRLRLPPEPGPHVPDEDAWDDEGRGDDDPVDHAHEDRAAGRRRPGRSGDRGHSSAWSTATWGERVAQRWLPASLREARWDPGRLGALALAVVAVVAAVVAGMLVWGGRPTPEPVPALPVIGAPADPPRVATAPPAAAPAGPMIVSVAGKVAHPGLVRLPEGSRIGDALDAAGGALPDTDLTPLNLAARLSDGEQVLVGVTPPPGSTVAGAAGTGAASSGGSSGGSAGGSGSAGASSGAPAGPAGGRVDLNAATLEQLDELPGVGPVTAKKILDWRTQNGRFTAVEQLREISGIGEARFATLRDVVTV